MCQNRRESGSGADRSENESEHESDHEETSMKLSMLNTTLLEGNGAGEMTTANRVASMIPLKEKDGERNIEKRKAVMNLEIGRNEDVDGNTATWT